MGMMANDVSPSASALAAINGVIQLSIVLPQAIAPAFATSLFAYSIKNDIAGGNLVWIIFFVLTCTASVHSLFLREPTYDWRTGSDSEASSPTLTGPSSSANSTVGGTEDTNEQRH